MRYTGWLWIPYPPPDGTWYIGNASKGVAFGDLPRNGRGKDGAYIEGSYSVTGEAELCLYTEGEDTDGDPSPELQYPNYGGSRQVGEYPTNHCRLRWEFVDTPNTATISLGGRSATADLARSIVTDSVTFTTALIDDSWGRHGTPEAHISFGGIPVEGETRSISWTGRHDGNPAEPLEFAGSVEIGTGFCRVRNNGWLRSSVLEACIVSGGGVLYVPRVASWKGEAMAYDQPHPDGSIKWHLLHKWQHIYDLDGNPETPNYMGDDYPPTPIYIEKVGQTVTHSIKQNAGFANYSTYNKAISVTTKSDNWRPVRRILGGAVYNYAHGEYEFGPVQVHLTPPAGEDPKDWRCGIKGKEFQALRLVHKPMLDIGGITWAKAGNVWTGTLTNHLRSDGYRYMRCDAGCTLVEIGGKKWAIGEGDSLDIDLCCPDNTGAAIDGQNTSYPLDENMRPTVEGPLWGINFIKVVKVTKAGNVAPVLKLVRKHDASSSFLETFGEWQEWKPENYHPNEGGSSGDWYEYFNIQRGAIGECDGRQTFEAFDVLRVTSTAPGRKWADDYYHRSIADVGNQIRENPAYEVYQGSDADPYHNPSLPAWFMGQGFTVSRNQNRKGFEVPNESWLYAQPLFDSIEWRDNVGDVFDIGNGNEKGPIELRSIKVFRGRAYGNVHDGGGGRRAKVPDPPVYVIARNTDDDFIEITQTTDVNSGTYKIGPTRKIPNRWGRVSVHFDTDADNNIIETGKAGVGGVPRKIQRVSFRLTLPQKGSAPSLDMTVDGTWVRAFAKDGKLVTGNASRVKPEWSDTDHDINVNSVCLRSVKHDKKQALELHYAYEDKDASKPSAIYRRVSYTLGKTWSEPEEMRNGKLPAFVYTDDGHRIDYWQDGDRIKGQLFDKNNKPLKTKGGDVFEVASGADDSTGVSVDYTVKAKGKREYGLLLTQGGEIKFYTSGNAIDWSPAA